MLRALSVSNYALIGEIALEFGPGLTVITGETGAGKSILVGAQGMVLGERRSADVIREGAESARAEALFDLQDEPVALAHLRERVPELDLDEELVVAREVSRTARSRCTLNGRLVTLAQLRALGNLLVDLHGQHDHQALLDPATHIGYLDAFGGHQALALRTAQAFATFRGLQETVQSAEHAAVGAVEQLELVTFQLDEIRKADPQPGELETLGRERDRLANAEELRELLLRAASVLYESDEAVISAAATAASLLGDAAAIDPLLKNMASSLESVRYELEDIARSVQSAGEAVAGNPERLEEVLARIDQLTRLARKYGGTIEAVLERAATLEAEVVSVEDHQAEVRRLKGEMTVAAERYLELARELDGARVAAAQSLVRAVVAHLAELSMEGAQFEIQRTWPEDPTDPTTWRSSGIGRTEYLVSANPGEPLKPLRAVASGGEISRIMLALKASLAAADHVSTLIFDEIDRGVSGRTAEACGHALRELAASHQVVAITHLPQIAKMGTSHYAVEKTSRRGRTLTFVRPLDLDDRARELARLLGGAKITEITLQHAYELLKRDEAAP